ncbi:MAG TPA: hypothetical protein VFP70_10790, partial [Burkholderiales bacterium]|nr:hypothetical protein [Burkholderiales bacterium]
MLRATDRLKSRDRPPQKSEGRQAAPFLFQAPRLCRQAGILNPEVQAWPLAEHHQARPRRTLTPVLLEFAAANSKS